MSARAIAGPASVWRLLWAKETFALLLLYCAFSVGLHWPHSSGHSLDALRHPALLIELVLPGIYAQRIEGPETAAPPIAVMAAPAVNLPLDALIRQTIGPQEHVRRSAYFGVLGPLMWLVLAVMFPWSGRIILGVLMAGLIVLVLLTQQFPEDATVRALAIKALVILFFLSMGGFFGLSDRVRKPVPAGFLLVLGSLSVVIAAVCTGLAVQAGALTDRALLATFLDRLSAPAANGEAGSSHWSPGLLAQNAAHLRAVLDHAALAAFASMTVLLLHLKSRTALTYWLIAIVWAADMVTASWLG